MTSFITSNAMRLSAKIYTTKGKVQELADQSGAKGKNAELSNQEVNTGVTLQKITQAQGKVLHRALSETGTDVQRVQKRLDRFEQVYRAADGIDGSKPDGNVDRSESEAAEKNWLGWLEVGASPRSTEAQIKEAFEKTVHVMGPNGKMVAVSNPGSLLEELNKLAGE